jgi:hypothetical protein
MLGSELLMIVTRLIYQFYTLQRLHIFTHKCYPFDKGSRLPIHPYRGDKVGYHYEAFTKFHQLPKTRYGF